MMIKDINIGQYIPGESFIHKLDPRTKILISLFYIIDLFIINNFKGYIYVVLFIGVIILVSKIKLRYIYKGLKPVFILLIITAILNIFMTKGGVEIYSGKIFKFIHIYSRGLEVAAFMVLRLTFLIVGTSILTLTTSPIQLTDGIEKLLNPLKRFNFPAHELAMMMTIALRFIPTLIDETDKIMKAQRSRGADFESGNIVNRAKNLIPILVPLFVNSFKRADDLAIAMESRGYRGGVGRTRMNQIKFTKKDVIAFVFFGVFVALSIMSR